MCDSLANMKHKIRVHTIAFSPLDGIINLDNYAQVQADIIAISLNITDSEVINKLREITETVLSLQTVFAAKESGWCSVGEWIEAHCRHLIKHPRKNAAKWRYWFINIFDILDIDHDGYINKEEFNKVYLMSRRKDDNEFLARAFSSIDSSNTGLVSKEQYVDTNMKYMTDPDVTYDQYPFF